MTAIIVAWYDCCGIIARSFLLTRIVRGKHENGNEKIATVFVKLDCGINPLPTAYAPATFIVMNARHIDSPSYGVQTTFYFHSFISFWGNTQSRETTLIIVTVSFWLGKSATTNRTLHCGH